MYAGATNKPRTKLNLALRMEVPLTKPRTLLTKPRTTYAGYVHASLSSGAHSAHCARHPRPPPGQGTTVYDHVTLCMMMRHCV